ncbi:acyl-CoA thioesterase [Pendulispora albinea]|uniref:Thioesterase family protein n=1 Tax=Pendulispora albinea TaxID=2741071 RepID=A0ABZ2LJ33_9BACT
MSFQVRISVRVYELDLNGHLGGAAYIHYADHVRWQLCRAAGVSFDELRASGVGPINLETTVRYHRELRADDEVDISCTFVFGEGKTFRVQQQFRRSDGTLAAEVISVGGLLDLKDRKLVPDPASHWRAVARSPELLGLRTES